VKILRLNLVKVLRKFEMKKRFFAIFVAFAAQRFSE